MSQEPLEPSAERLVRPPSREQLQLIKKWVALFAEHYRQEVSELAMAGYIEGLKDLSLKEIQQGCEHALLTMGYMPTVANIRSRTHASQEFFNTNVDRGCADCQYTGWLMVDGKATKCHCRSGK